MPIKKVIGPVRSGFQVLLFQILFVCLTMLLSKTSSAETRVKLLQTSDLHSHFENNDSRLGLGGFARLKTQIDRTRSLAPDNTLLLDSGDWSEGTIFFTLNSGESSHKMMEQMGYDAATLGNHEWLVGPFELAASFQNAKFKVPVLSANINMVPLGPAIPLNQYIRPHLVKEIGGKKIGIIGLSTFQLIYDSFLEPVELREPFTVAALEVNYLRDIEKCDMIVVISHMGYPFDQALAKGVPGIDVILGGHSHLLLETPDIINGTVISHIGRWGEYLGDLDFVIGDDGKVRFESRKIHQIDESIPEDPLILAMVGETKTRIEKLLGPVFENKVAYSEVPSNIHNSESDDAVSNWAVDALREVGAAELAFDHSRYAARDIEAGWTTLADVFNTWPHVFKSTLKKAWTVYTFEVPGISLNLMTQLLYRFDNGVRISGGQIVVDMDAAVWRVKNFLVGNRPLANTRFYKVAATEGILQAFRLIEKKSKVTFGIRNAHDTGVEAWRAIANKLNRVSPITPAKAYWQGRVRTVQPDIYLPYSQLVFWKGSDGTMEGRFEIINAGLTDSTVPNVKAQIDVSPRKNTLRPQWVNVDVNVSKGRLAAGNKIEGRLKINTRNLPSGPYRFVLEASTETGEKLISNNSIKTVIRILPASDSKELGR